MTKSNKLLSVKEILSNKKSAFPLLTLQVTARKITGEIFSSHVHLTALCNSFIEVDNIPLLSLSKSNMKG